MFKKLKEKYNKTSELNKFLVKGISLYFIWRVFRKYMLLWGQYEDYTDKFADVYLNLSQFFLKITGFKTFVDFDLNKLWIAGAEKSIEVVYDCLGTNLFVVFTIFIIIYPGKIITKLWYIPAGVAVIFLLNAIRMSAMAYIADVSPQNFEIFHHFIFQGVIYGVIFLMWFGFVRLSAFQKKS
ncbi:MAG: exosortase/archaeosortase family protein [Prolixibacteraceae bacterium]|nr:exosortase/archaeosortase family protein [Prolixibacteraceae bacterium]